MTLHDGYYILTAVCFVVGALWLRVFSSEMAALENVRPQASAALARSSSPSFVVQLPTEGDSAWRVGARGKQGKPRKHV